MCALPPLYVAVVSLACLSHPLAAQTGAESVPDIEDKTESVSPPDDLARRLAAVMPTIADAVYDVQRMRDDFPAFEARLDALAARIATIETALRAVCGDDLAEGCAPTADATEERLAVLEARLAVLETTASQPEPRTDALAADRGSLTSIEPVAPETPFRFVRRADRQPRYPTRREMDATAPVLLEAESCEAAGTWLTSQPERYADALFVNHNGVVRRCVMAGGDWSVFSAGRNDRAHLIEEGDGR